MTSFLPVNNNPAPKDLAMEDVKTPTGSRPFSDSKDARASSSNGPPHDSQPPPASSHPQRAPSTASTGDETTIAEDDGDRDQSDTEQTAAAAAANDAAPPSKKKKGQRFFCTDFPPCQLSFTRSEHLARHIRKHTGERPFQCHCSRRFSRLDNLRQHAQTVHVNEEIPGDSLAATGTRFQRQIRTDRVRPPGRARAGTTGSQGGHTRGHSRNLSTSSITSTTSTLSQPPEIRRRPPPLIMAGDGPGRSHPPLGVLGEPTTPPGQVRNMPAQSPGGYPTFTAGGGSPHYASPISGGPQPGFWDGKGHVRRLSVPSGTNPFTAHGATYPPPYVTSVPQSHTYTSNTSVYGSPTMPSYPPARDEGVSASEADLRRRTWHPSTYSLRPVTSGLASYEPANTLRPAFGANNADSQPPRLPGIESFDKVIQGRPLTPPLRKPSPMQVDTPSRAPPAPPNHAFTPGFAAPPPTTRPQPPIAGPGHRRGQISWDLHYNLTGLNLGGGPPQHKETAAPWGQQTLGEIHSIGSRPTSSERPPSHHNSAALPHHEPSTPQNTKRYGFQAPSGTPGSHVTRTSPEDSSSSEGVATPSTISMDYHPAIVHSNGHVEQPSNHDTPVNNCTPVPTQRSGYTAHERRPSVLEPSSGAAPGMGRLEALVAVATSEGKAAARLF